GRHGLGVEPGQILGDRLAQRRDAALEGVEGLAGAQGRRRRVADEGGGRQIALAEPERNDRGIAEPLGRDLADQRGGKGGDRWPDAERARGERDRRWSGATKFRQS